MLVIEKVKEIEEIEIMITASGVVKNTNWTW